MGICTDPDILNIIRIAKVLIMLLEAIIIVALIIFAMIDIIKLITSSDVDTKKTLNKMIKRLIAACIILLVPVIVNISIGLVSTTMDYENCLANANDEYINNAYINKADDLVSKAMASMNVHDLNLAERYVNNITDDQIRSNLLNRIDALKGYINDRDSEKLPDIYTPLGNYSNISGYSSNGKCNINNITEALSSEPDPSCAINYWKNKKLMTTDFTYPKDSNGNKLGAHPTNISAPRQLSNPKSYQSGIIIFPITTDNAFTYPNHDGLDLSAPVGTPVYSPVDGTILKSRWGDTKNRDSDETAYTVQITLDQPFFYNGNKITIVYLTHLSGIIYRVEPNSNEVVRVKKGQLIGYSGIANDSPHLHISYYNDQNKTVKDSHVFAMYDMQNGTSKGAGE